MASIISVNVSMPRPVEWDGGTVPTAIFKQPVEGPVTVRRLNLDGDRQGDPIAHGGPYKAVYVYPAGNYPFWEAQMPDVTFEPGAFGENLTVAGISEQEIRIGDRFRAGSAELLAVQPRYPCYKLGIRLGRQDAVKRFMRSGRPGIYCSVLIEGTLRRGDRFELIEPAEESVTLAEVALLLGGVLRDRDLLNRAIALPALAPACRAMLQRRRNGRWEE